jgi:NAD(P)-dependent dehydrogenase (short-subunit alcohol dehydrogenase family)
VSELSGVALVTGGGRGIGRGIALELARAGMRVAVSARTRSEVDETAREAGGLAVEADVSREEDAARMVAEVERELGPIDLLVNNAGIAHWEERAWEDDPAAWWRVFEVNVRGPFLVSRAVIPGMIERGRGRIVNTGSGAAYLPGTANTAYGASKAALYRFGETLAQQLEPHGIPVFTISPGDDRRPLPRRRAVDAARARPAVGAGAREREARRAVRPLHPRRARRRRRPGSAGGRGGRERPERDPAPALSDK